jgi:hypothetical protein
MAGFAFRAHDGTEATLHARVGAGAVGIGRARRPSRHRHAQRAAVAVHNGHRRPAPLPPCHRRPVFRRSSPAVPMATLPFSHTSRLVTTREPRKARALDNSGFLVTSEPVVRAASASWLYRAVAPAGRDTRRAATKTNPSGSLVMPGSMTGWPGAVAAERPRPRLFTNDQRS